MFKRYNKLIIIYYEKVFKCHFKKIKISLPFIKTIYICDLLKIEVKYLLFVG